MLPEVVCGSCNGADTACTDHCCPALALQPDWCLGDKPADPGSATHYPRLQQASPHGGAGGWGSERGRPVSLWCWVVQPCLRAGFRGVHRLAQSRNPRTVLSLTSSACPQSRRYLQCVMLARCPQWLMHHVEPQMLLACAPHCAAYARMPARFTNVYIECSACVGVAYPDYLGEVTWPGVARVDPPGRSLPGTL